MIAPGCARSVAHAASWMGATLGRFAPDVDVAVLGDLGDALDGVTRDELLGRVRGCAALLDVMGFCGDDEVLSAASRRIGVDIDPGFAQLWAAAGLADPFDTHDEVVTVGLNVGSDRSWIPSLGRRWVPCLPPVVLEHWPDRGPSDGPVTSVGAWRGPTGPLEHDGRRLGLRVHAAGSCSICRSARVATSGSRGIGRRRRRGSRDAALARLGAGRSGGGRGNHDRLPRLRLVVVGRALRGEGALLGDAQRVVLGPQCGLPGLGADRWSRATRGCPSASAHSRAS